VIRFALAGNPNSGKTTLFNTLTGSTAHVGNWPGVTVDKRDGVYKKCAEPISIVDLPGIYSLSPYTPEEVVSRNYILDEKPDCVINIVDATNLERNLYLTTQLMEIDVPLVIALNMMDEVTKNGDKLDAKKLESRIGVPVVEISALKGHGVDELMERAYSVCKTPRVGQTVLKNSSLAHLIGDVRISLEGKGVESPLFHAVKLVEMDELEVAAHSDCVGMVEAFKATFSDDTFGTDIDALVADGRYNYITKNFSIAYTRAKKNIEAPTNSDKIDKVLTHKVWGIPIFLVIMFAIFHLTFSENFLFLGAALGEDFDPLAGTSFEGLLFGGAIFSPGVMIFNVWNDIIVATVFGWLESLVGYIPLHPAIEGLIVDGVLSGVSSVMSFLPQILILFLFFSILEDSGYMARVAFILDRIFRKFGLSGRAFMPMIMGFGCSVPAMANTRTLADEKERTTTIRIIPFFSCGAKLPILVAIAGAIVGQSGLTDGYTDIITYSMYLLGIIVAIASVILMRGTTMRGEVSPFIMELPTYRRPQFRNLMALLWDKSKHFIKKAFTIILASTIVIWFLSNFRWDWSLIEEETKMGESILASLGQLIQPVFTPLGFGSQLGAFGWVFGVAAITGLIAKEDVISTFGALGAVIVGAAIDIEADGGLSAVTAMIQATEISVPALISFIAFNMLTIPCFAAVATAKAELQDKKKFNWTLIFWIVTSYLVSAIIYTVGEYVWPIAIWVLVLGLVFGGVAVYNKSHKKA